jgi:hypothetical protein
MSEPSREELLARIAELKRHTGQKKSAGACRSRRLTKAR